MELPLYILDINDDQPDESGVFAVGLVEMPAIERKYLAFSENKPREFKVVSEEKRLLAGYLMAADQPIYRRDEDGKEYYVAFPATSIMKIVNKFSRAGVPMTFNYDHQDSTPTKSAYLHQHFIVNSEMGLPAPEMYGKAPEGSWFGVVKVEDEKEWEEAKKRGGFSVEGYFNEFKILDAEDQLLEDVKNAMLQLEEA